MRNAWELATRRLVRVIAVYRGNRGQSTPAQTLTRCIMGDRPERLLDPVRDAIQRAVLEPPARSAARGSIPHESRTPRRAAHVFGAPVKTGKVSSVQVLHSKGLANHTGPESCAGTSNRSGEALTGERAGWVSSREIRIDLGAPTVSNNRKAIQLRSVARDRSRLRVVRDPIMHGNILCGNRESPCPPAVTDGMAGRVGKPGGTRR